MLLNLVMKTRHRRVLEAAGAAIVAINIPEITPVATGETVGNMSLVPVERMPQANQYLHKNIDESRELTAREKWDLSWRLDNQTSAWWETGEGNGRGKVRGS